MPKVKVIFPDGRTAWLDSKHARSPQVVDMGGEVVQDPEPVRRYAPIIGQTPSKAPRKKAAHKQARKKA